ncbi:MAG: hypothetical protein LBT43_21235 [Prevotella sp.]|jgi:hypothetical protein|nr:hypothetical protein [Prevotella sp.]
MKRIITLFLLIIISLGVKSQCNLPYKPLSEFSKDTTAFIIYNFMDRADCYKGKTLKEVTTDLGIPVKDYTRADIERGNLFGYIYIDIYDNITVSKLRDNRKDYNAIIIFWETPINVRHSDYKRLIGTDWNKAYEYMKDMRIKEVNVVIPRYSKYYEKYKQKETKSYDPNKRKEGVW